MGIVSTSGTVVIPQRVINVKGNSRSCQRYIEDAALFFEALR